MLYAISDKPYANSTMPLNPYSIPPLLCSLFAASLGIFVLLKNPQKAVNRSFFGLCLTIILWLSFYGVLYNFDIHCPWVMSWVRIAYCGVTFIAVIHLQHLQFFFQLHRLRKLIFFSYAWGILCSILIIKTDLIIQGLHQFYWGIYPKAGPWHPVFLATFVLLLLTGLIVILEETRRPGNTLQRINQAKYLFAAYSIFYLAAFDFVPNYGIAIYPFGYIPTTIFLLIIAYAIIKHQLMDITIALRAGLVYSLLATVITIVYFIMIWSVEKLFQGILGYQSFLTSLLTGVLIAVIFIPLKNKIQNFLDKYFFKGTQVEIAQQNERLLQEVAQTEKLKAIATLASGMAHEIRNPITVIKTFTEYLEKKKDDPQFIKDFQKNVDSEVHRMSHLIQQLLDFAKPAAVKTAPIEILELIKDTLQLLQNNFTKHNILVKTDFLSGPTHLSIDQNQFKQVFLNLFLNSIDAMPQGGTLSIQTTILPISNKPYAISPAPSAISHPPSAIRHEPRIIEITITDTGTGIDPKDLPTLFEPFVSKKNRGTGLGLSISQNIIQEHNGSIRLTSPGLGQGTTVTITLPTEPETRGDHA